MKIPSLLTLSTLALLCAVSDAAAQTPIVVKFSHVVARDTPKGMAAERFKQLAEERTLGRVKVEVYPNSSLFKDGEEMEALQLGSVQMLAPSMSKFGPMGLPQFELFDLPYIFPNRDILRRVTQGEVGRDLFKSLEPKGIVGLAYWDNGFKMMSANRPLHMPADYKGLKMRIKSSKVIDAQMRALGVQPQVMAFSEVYQALQTGVVDGSENSLPNFYTQKFFEVQKYLALTAHGYDGYAVIVNKKFWDALPADVRTIARKGDAGGDRLPVRALAQGKPGRHREDQGQWAVRGLRADRRRKGRAAQGAGARAEGNGVAHRQDLARRRLQGSGRRRVQILNAVELDRRDRREARMNARIPIRLRVAGVG